jgi:hypothetical protein
MSNNDRDNVYDRDYAFLFESFIELCAYCRRALECSLGLASATMGNADNKSAAEPNTLQHLDPRLPKVSAGLILTSQCLNTLCLLAHENLDPDKGIKTGCHAVYSSMQGDGVAESLIG